MLQESVKKTKKRTFFCSPLKNVLKQISYVQGFFFGETERELRPFARRRATTRLPAFVSIRARNP